MRGHVPQLQPPVGARRDIAFRLSEKQQTDYVERSRRFYLLPGCTHAAVAAEQGWQQQLPAMAPEV